MQSVNVKPQLATGSGLLAQQSEAGQPGSPVAPGQQITAAQADASTASNGGTTTVNVGGKTINIIVGSDAPHTCLHKECLSGRAAGRALALSKWPCLTAPSQTHTCYAQAPKLTVLSFVQGYPIDLNPCIAANPAAFGVVYNLLSGLIARSHTSLQVPTSGNPEQATGSYLAGIAGVRISTPLFGTGFNFCVGVDKASAPLLFRTLPAIQEILADIQCVIDVTQYGVCCVLQTGILAASQRWELSSQMQRPGSCQNFRCPLLIYGPNHHSSDYIP